MPYLKQADPTDLDSKNLEIGSNKNSALWIDNVSHKFTKKLVGLPIPKEYSWDFEYEGSGHADFGVLKRNGSCEDWITKVRVKCNKEHGKCTVRIEGKRIILIYIGGQHIYDSDDDLHGENLFLGIDIRFGDVLITAPEAGFVSESLQGVVNGNLLQLISTTNQHGQCLFDQPLTTEKTLEVAIEAAPNCRYWHAEICLTNQRNNPQNHVYKLKSLKNHTGTIQLFRDENGIQLTYKDKIKTAKQRNIHLSQDVYVYFKLFRAKIQINQVQDSTQCLPYLKFNPCTQTQVSVEEECAYGNNFPSQNRNIRSGEMLESTNPKIPRLNSEQIEDEEQTRPKNLTHNEDYLKFIEMLKRIGPIVELNYDEYEPVVTGVKRKMAEKLFELENSCSSQDLLADAQRRFEETFQIN